MKNGRLLSLYYPRVAVEARGRPVRLAISGGQLHDRKMMAAFLNWQKPPLAIVADKAYGSTKIRQAIADEGVVAAVPSKSSPQAHPARHKPLCQAQYR